MTREIKFRAWDKIDKRMCEVGFIDFVNSWAQLAIIVDNTRMAYGTWECNFDDIEMLEFTGLHDKNGKEIYAGHIVSCDEYYIGDNLIPFGIGEVCYGNGSFYIAYEFSPELCSEEISNCGIEVIGNIHENKELLEENA